MKGCNRLKTLFMKLFCQSYICQLDQGEALEMKNE